MLVIQGVDKPALIRNQLWMFRTVFNNRNALITSDFSEVIMCIACVLANDLLLCNMMSVVNYLEMIIFY